MCLGACELSRLQEKPWFSLWNLECQLPRFQFRPMPTPTPTPSPSPIPYRQPAGPSSPPLKMPPCEAGGTPFCPWGRREKGRLSSVEDAPGLTDRWGPGNLEFGTWNLELGSWRSLLVDGAGGGRHTGTRTPTHAETHSSTRVRTHARTPAIGHCRRTHIRTSVHAQQANEHTHTHTAHARTRAHTHIRQECTHSPTDRHKSRQNPRPHRHKHARTTHTHTHTHTHKGA